MSRIEGMSAIIADRNFSRYRGYRSILNDLVPDRHQFSALQYAMMRNGLVVTGQA